MPPNDRPIVTRFAPSPTGHLHIGGARTALFCWAFARRHGGAIMIRIEDTDQARSSEASARGILADLAWLGIDWDEGPTLAEHDRAPGGAPLKPGVIGGDPRGVAPFFQSQRLPIYNGLLDRLIESGHAYAAFETTADLEAKRKAAAAAGKQYRYDRAALDIPKPERDARARAGEPHVVRFRTPDEPVVVHDIVLGEVRVGPEELDDFVLRKADGFPTYHFGVVADDQTMGVTHVLRGQEHLYNTPKHVSLQRALGFRTPVYAHMPLIFNEQGTKMSKRERDQTARRWCAEKGLAHAPDPVRGTPGLDDAAFSAWLKDKAKQLETHALERLASEVGLSLPEVSVDDFRRAGFLPEVITNFIALLGWSPPAEAGENVEKFDLPFLAKWFELERIGKTNARFDRKKLLAFNTDAMGGMSDAEFARRWRPWCQTDAPRLAALPPEQFDALAAAVRPRSKTLREAAQSGGFLFLDDAAIAYDPKAVEKNLKADAGEGLRALRSIREGLASLPSFEPAAIHALIEQTASAMGVGLGKVAQPLRVALTGTTVSPPIDATAALLGRERTLARIDACLAANG